MGQERIDFDIVRKIGLELPDVVDASVHGGAALKLRGRLLACQTMHKSAEPNSLMLRVSFDERERLLAADPDTYYMTDHYAKYPSILVRLEQIDRSALEEVMGAAWRFLMEKR
ncbi:MAG: hypothetical protein PVH89_13105 [Gammaproteobacteria bacterium]|jgi:hypothetical protein